MKLRLKIKNIYTRRVMNDRYDINRNRITRRSRELRTFDPNVFPPNLIPTGFGGESIRHTFCICNEIFPLVFDLVIYICFIYTYRNLLASFHKLNTREFSGSFDLGERTEIKEFRIRGCFPTRAALCSRLQITFYCPGKNIKVNEKVRRVVGRALRETTPSIASAALLSIEIINSYFSRDIRYHFPFMIPNIRNREKIVLLTKKQIIRAGCKFFANSNNRFLHFLTSLSILYNLSVQIP